MFSLCCTVRWRWLQQQVACQALVGRAVTKARTCFGRQLLVGGLDLLQGSQLLLHYQPSHVIV
jgi:hypothetical protein